MYHTVISLKFPLGDYTILTLQPEANDAYLHLKLRRLMTKKKSHPTFIHDSTTGHK